MKDNKRIYSRAELVDLVNKDYTCIILKECTKRIELHPKYYKDVIKGIKEALNKGLNKFDYNLNGVPLDYRNLVIVEDKWSGRIVGRLGEFIATVRAEFFVFYPKIGNLLEGIVQSKRDTYIGCLVHKCFNAMILKPENEENWNCKSIKEQDKIVFTIVDHVFSGPIPYIEGHFAPDFNPRNSHLTSNKSDDSDNELGGSKESGKLYMQQESITNQHKKIKNLEDMEIIFSQNKSEKTKSKKKKNLSIDGTVGDSMENDTSAKELVVEKTPKKKKTKSDNFLETEKNVELLDDNQPHIFTQIMTTTNNEDESSYVVKNKKRGKKKISEKNKNEEQELVVVQTLDDMKQTKTKKRVKETNLENVDEEPIPKKKKKKHDSEGSTGHFAEEKQIRVSPSKKDDLSCEGLNFSFNELIEILKDNLSSSSLSSSDDDSKNKIVNKSDRSKSAKHTKLDGNKNIKEEMDKSSNKLKKASYLDNSVEKKCLEGEHEDSPRKKSRLDASAISSKSFPENEKSLFTDSGDSCLSPEKRLPNPIIPDVDSSRTTEWKLGVSNLKSDNGKVVISPNNPKKSHGQLVAGEENKSKEKSDTAKERNSENHVISKKEKSSGKKSTLGDPTKDTISPFGKFVNNMTEGPTETKKTEAAKENESKSSKKKKGSKAVDNLVVAEALSNSLPIVKYNDSVLDEPLTSSTPKSKPDDLPNKKTKEEVRKSRKTSKEKLDLINSILAETRKNLGLDEVEKTEKTTKKVKKVTQPCQTTMISWLNRTKQIPDNEKKILDQNHT